MECAKMSSAVRKVKKKQVKDELDRLKQAEKKKRRIEKALATSAAIISELEKKKQKKKEEQQRLDEEGAAIAEAVALNVLLGEDSDDSCKIMLKENEKSYNWDRACNIDHFAGGSGTAFPYQDLSKHSLEGLGWLSNNACRPGFKWNDWGNCDQSISCVPFERDLGTLYFDEENWDARDISAGLIAARAVSSLQIAEDSHADAMIFNRM